MRKWITREGRWICPQDVRKNLFQIVGLRDDGQQFYRNNWFHYPISEEKQKAYEDHSYTIFDIWLDDRCHCHVIGTASLHCKIHGDYLDYVIPPDRLLSA